MWNQHILSAHWHTKRMDNVQMWAWNVKSNKVKVKDHFYTDHTHCCEWSHMYVRTYVCILLYGTKLQSQLLQPEPRGGIPQHESGRRNGGPVEVGDLPRENKKQRMSQCGMSMHTTQHNTHTDIRTHSNTHCNTQLLWVECTHLFELSFTTMLITWLTSIGYLVQWRCHDTPVKGQLVNCVVMYTWNMQHSSVYMHQLKCHLQWQNLTEHSQQALLELSTTPHTDTDRQTDRQTDKQWSLPRCRRMRWCCRGSD